MLTALVLISSCSLLASVPLVGDLQGRIAELTAKLNQQSPALAKATEEVTRLQGVETDLNRTIHNLRTEIAALEKKHLADIASVTATSAGLLAERDAAVSARDALQAERDEAVAARDSIRKDRDEHIAKYEEMEKHYTEENARMRRRAKGFCDSLTEMDLLLSGKSLMPSTFFDCFLLVSDCSYFSFLTQKPGLNLKRLPTQLSPSPERIISLLEGPVTARTTSGPDMNI